MKSVQTSFLSKAGTIIGETPFSNKRSKDFHAYSWVDLIKCQVPMIDWICLSVNTLYVTISFMYSIMPLLPVMSYIAITRHLTTIETIR